MNFNVYYYSSYANNYYFYHSYQRTLYSVWLVFDMDSVFSIQFCNVAIQMIRFRIKHWNQIWIFNRNTFAIRSYSFHIFSDFRFRSIRTLPSKHSYSIPLFANFEFASWHFWYSIMMIWITALICFSFQPYSVSMLCMFCVLSHGFVIASRIRNQLL